MYPPLFVCMHHRVHVLCMHHCPYVCTIVCMYAPLFVCIHHRVHVLCMHHCVSIQGSLVTPQLGKWKTDFCLQYNGIATSIAIVILFWYNWANVLHWILLSIELWVMMAVLPNIVTGNEGSGGGVVGWGVRGEGEHIDLMTNPPCFIFWIMQNLPNVFPSLHNTCLC